MVVDGWFFCKETTSGEKSKKSDLNHKKTLMGLTEEVFKWVRWVDPPPSLGAHGCLCPHRVRHITDIETVDLTHHTWFDFHFKVRLDDLLLVMVLNLREDDTLITNHVSQPVLFKLDLLRPRIRA